MCGGVTEALGEIQQGSGRCWASLAVAKGAAGMQVQASGLGLECNREFPVSLLLDRIAACISCLSRMSN